MGIYSPVEKEVKFTILTIINEILKNLIQVDEEDYDYLLELIYRSCIEIY